MAQNKTVRYAIEFSGHETLNSLPIHLNQGEYMKQLCELTKQYEEHKDDEEAPIEKRVYTKEYDTHVNETTFFTIGTSDIILRKSTCKPGYRFK